MPVIIHSQHLSAAVYPWFPAPASPRAECSSLHIHGAYLNKSNFVATFNLESMLPKKRMSAGARRAHLPVGSFQSWKD